MVQMGVGGMLYRNQHLYQRLYERRDIPVVAQYCDGSQNKVHPVPKVSVPHDLPDVVLLLRDHGRGGHDDLLNTDRFRVDTVTV